MFVVVVVVVVVVRAALIIFSMQVLHVCVCVYVSSNISMMIYSDSFFYAAYKICACVSVTVGIFELVCFLYKIPFCCGCCFCWSFLWYIYHFATIKNSQTEMREIHFFPVRLSPFVIKQIADGRRFFRSCVCARVWCEFNRNENEAKKGDGK